MTICKQWVKYENMKKECLIAQWRIHDHMQAVGQCYMKLDSVLYGRVSGLHFETTDVDRAHRFGCRYY